MGDACVVDLALVQCLQSLYVRERKASHERMHAHITQKQERTGVAESGCKRQETRNYNQMAINYFTNREEIHERIKEQVEEDEEI